MCSVTSFVSFFDTTDLPPGYPYQSITAPFGTHLQPYHITAPANTDIIPGHRSHSPSSGTPLPSAQLHSRLLSKDLKPKKLEPSKMASFLKQEPAMERPQDDVTPEPLGPLCRSSSPALANRDREGDVDAVKLQLLPLRVSTPPQQQVERHKETKEEEKEGIKMEVSSYSCEAAYALPSSLTDAKPKPEVIKDPEEYPSCNTEDVNTQICTSQEEASTTVCKPKQADTPITLLPPSQKEIVSENPLCSPPSSNSPLPLVPEDPMAGMLALLTASEMAQTHPRTHSASPESSSTGALEMVALEGMALLSQMAQQEISMDQGEEIVDVGAMI